MRVIVIDYDGVLHSADVWVSAGASPRLAESEATQTLFEHAPLLAGLLEQHPDVMLLLSTSWVSVFGYETAVARLPSSLAVRVLGATFRPDVHGPGFAAIARGYQVQVEIRRRGIRDWIALDDDVKDWPEEDLDHLIATDPQLGISEPGALAKLRAWLVATKLV
jgi:hypothetical protein